VHLVGFTIEILIFSYFFNVEINVKVIFASANNKISNGFVVELLE